MDMKGLTVKHLGRDPIYNAERWIVRGFESADHALEYVYDRKAALGHLAFFGYVQPQDASCCGTKWQVWCTSK